MFGLRNKKNNVLVCTPIDLTNSEVHMGQCMKIWYFLHRRAVNAQTRQNFHCSHSGCMDVDNSSDQNSDV